MSEIKVQRARQYWQRALVNSIRVDVCVKELGIDAATDFDKYDNNETMYVLATDGQVPAGTCRLRFAEEEGVAKIERVNVIKEYRGSGVGGKLLAEAEKWAYENGFTQIVITSREEAVSFYEKNGYTAFPEEKYQSSVYVVIPMKKRLRTEII